MTKRKILVADCEPQTVDTLRASLIAGGYDVSTAHDGLETTRKAMVEQPDLILLDLGMPAGKGHVVVERLHNIQATSHIPVIGLARSGTGADGVGRRAGGCARCISRPFETSELLAIVENELAALGSCT